MSTTFQETRDQISSDALQLIGYLASGETAQTADLTFCANAVNKMIKAWMAQGIHLFTEEEGILYLTPGQQSYILTTTGGANGAANADAAVTTTLSTTASGSSIVVTSATGMSINDNIGIVLNSNTIFWTTVSNIVGTTITLASPLSGTANSGNLVYDYTISMVRPLSIQTARCRDAQNFDRIIRVKPRQDYMAIPQKSLIGQPQILYYSPQTTTGIIYLWPAPAYANTQVRFTYLREINDVTNPTDDFDFPQEWLECLTYNLAVRIAPAYGINLSAGGITGNPGLVTQAAQYLEDLKAWDSEQPFVQFVPGWDYNSGGTY